LLMRLVTDANTAKARSRSSPFHGIRLLDFVDFIRAEFRTID
jgi:hypothetical protein